MPTLVSIPAWNAEGLLPPINVAAPTSAHRAPYPVSLVDVAMRFGTSSERIAILRGLIDYRAALHATGLTNGFQWIDGSFLEHVEASPRNRPPGDVDVVTFFWMPTGLTQRTLRSRAPNLFPTTAVEHDALKTRFRVDAFPVELGRRGDLLVKDSAYWYGLWAHQRSSFKWKGFLQIDLAPAEDASALARLTPLPPGSTP